MWPRVLFWFSAALLPLNLYFIAFGTLSPVMSAGGGVMDLIRRALILWRAWRARKVFGREIASLRQAIQKARKAHKPRAHLSRRLSEARHAQLRMEQGHRS